MELTLSAYSTQEWVKPSKDSHHFQKVAMGSSRAYLEA
jgi:hypothetical protein